MNIHEACSHIIDYIPIGNKEPSNKFCVQYIKLLQARTLKHKLDSVICALTRCLSMYYDYKAYFAPTA